MDWTTDSIAPRDVVLADPETRRREIAQAVARDILAMRPGDSLKVEMHTHDDPRGIFTITYTTPDRVF